MTATFAQKQANIWHFGYGAGLDFNTTPPTPLTDGQTDSREGCSSIANKNGDLLFYTNGVTVWNKEHEVMDNGTGLKGDSSSTQSSIIVPQPGSNDIYYVFTVDYGGAGNAANDGLNYTIVDMSKNDGLGEIQSKNVPLFAPANEKLTAVNHNNMEDVWMIAQKADTTAFHAYLVTANGINAPIISTVGNASPGFVGMLKASPNGTFLCAANNLAKRVELFDFNNATGEITNPRTVLAGNLEQFYGIEFSPSEKRLYVADFIGDVYQLDLTAEDIMSSQIVISMDAFSGSIQLAPDGKIYVSRPGQTTLDVIHNPDNLADSCNYESNAIDLEGRRSQLGLPQFIQSYFAPIPEMETSVYIPSAFSPNDDNINDVFTIPNQDAFSTYDLEIFTRWGESIFKTNQLNDAWDGTFKNGTFAPQGTYPYVINISDSSGISTNYYGKVTLLK